MASLWRRAAATLFFFEAYELGELGVVHRALVSRRHAAWRLAGRRGKELFALGLLLGALHLVVEADVVARIVIDVELDLVRLRVAARLDLVTRTRRVEDRERLEQLGAPRRRALRVDVEDEVVLGVGVAA